MTDDPPPLAEPHEPPRGRAALQVTTLRGGAAALAALWIGATARWLEVQPGELVVWGPLAIAVALALLLRLWRTRMSPAEVGVALVVLADAPLLGIARIDSPTIAFVSLVGLLVGGALVGALGAAERAALEGASSLRARGAVALACGLGAFVGCGVVAMQTGFTWGVVSGGSVHDGYAFVDRLVTALRGKHLVVPGLIAGFVAVVTFARLCHERVGAQLLSTLCLTPLAVVAPVLLLPRPAILVLAALPCWLLVFALRGLDGLERRLGRYTRPAPRALPTGSGRRALVTVVVGLVALSSLHGGLTLFAARRRAHVLDELARRGEPIRQEDLGTIPADEDGFLLHRRAASAYRAPPRRLITTTPSDDIARLTSFRAANAPALALFSEGARRPRCGIVSGTGARFVSDAARDLFDNLLRLHLLQGDVDGAVETIRLRRALFASAEPALAWREIGEGLAAAQNSTLELLARHDLSVESCLRLLALFERPVDDGFLRGAVQAARIGQIERWSVPLPDAPLAARLPWVRDLDLVDALAHVDAQEAVWFLNEHELRRRLCVIALSLRLHRLTTGSYPATLDALVPEHFVVVPRDLAGAPFAYALDGAGFTLSPVGQPRPTLRLKR